MSSVQYIGEVLGAFADAFEPLEESLAGGQSLSSFLTDFGWSMEPGADANAINAAFSSLPSLFTAIQEQLGLKVEGRKGPVEVLVIDHIERTPTEN